MTPTLTVDWQPADIIRIEENGLTHNTGIGEYSAKKIIFPHWVNKFPLFFTFSCLNHFLEKDCKHLHFFGRKLAKYALFQRKICTFWVKNIKIGTILGQNFPPLISPPPRLVFSKIFTNDHRYCMVKWAHYLTSLFGSRYQSISKILIFTWQTV